MKYNYKIKGIELSMEDMTQINQYYCAACTGEYLLENGYVDDEKEGLAAGYNVRDLMDKYNMTEEEAVRQYFHKEIRYINND